MSDHPQTAGPMCWLWHDSSAPSGFLVYFTKYPVDVRGDPKVAGEPIAGPLSLSDALAYIENHTMILRLE